VNLKASGGGFWAGFWGRRVGHAVSVMALPETEDAAGENAGKLPQVR
jgi:hypothetical protein